MPLMQKQNQKLLSEMRLHSSLEFSEIYAARITAGDAHLLVFARRNQLEATRFGLSISRKHGGAVVRNRKRRLLREAFRLNRTQLPTGLDLILIPRQRLDSTLQDFSRSLIKACRKLDRLIQPHDPA